MSLLTSLIHIYSIFFITLTSNWHRWRSGSALSTLFRVILCFLSLFYI